ncbi:MAG: cation:proton antiporter [Gammaproteobacteria bacterium]|nr:cation:proton antiporter [Gammaproteobacteria bacterium]
MEPIILALALAFVAGLVVRSIGYPPLLGYLLAGFAASAMDLGSAESLEPIAEAGILLLLFTIGLKLRIESLTPVYVWGTALINMAAVIPLTTAVILLVSSFFPQLAIDSQQTAWTLAFALSFSSTVLAVKLFDERGDVTSFYANIAIGILVVQDLLAVVYLSVSLASYPSPFAALLLLIPLFRHQIGRLLRAIGHGELLLLSGVVFALGAAALADFLHVKGGLAALAAGVLLAYSDTRKAKEIHDQLMGLKNLLLIGFFLQIGYYGFPSVPMIVVAGVLSLLLVLRPLIYFSLLTLFGLRARTSYLAGMSLATYSEFGLIVAAVAVTSGTLGVEWVTTLALAMCLSFFIATPLNEKIHFLYRKYQEPLERYERKELLPQERIESLGDADTVVLGMGRVGRTAYESLMERTATKLVGVDENYGVIGRLREQGFNCVRGDAADPDFWQRSKLQSRKLILVSLSNHQENLAVAHMAQELGCIERLCVVARFPDEKQQLEELGCVSFYLYEDTGRDFAEYSQRIASEH